MCRITSSYGKNTWFHQTVGITSFLLMVLCYLLLENKQCQVPLLPNSEAILWNKTSPGTELTPETLRKRNLNQTAEQLVQYVQGYYDLIQVFHLIIAGWCIVVILLGFINIVPKHEDYKVLIILIMICLMGIFALLSFYAAFVAFHQPCRGVPGQHVTRAVIRSGGLKDLRPPAQFRLEFRSHKDKRAVNVYEDEDETMIHVTLLDSGIAFILLCSNFLFFFDSRQHMIEWRN